MFLDTFVVKGIARFHVYRHFPNSKVSGNRRFNQILWILQGILNTESVKKHGNGQIFWLQKCQETWKRPIPLSTECSYKPVKRPNPLNREIMTFVTHTHRQLLLYINHIHHIKYYGHRLIIVIFRDLDLTQPSENHQPLLTKLKTVVVHGPPSGSRLTETPTESKSESIS